MGAVSDSPDDSALILRTPPLSWRNRVLLAVGIVTLVGLGVWTFVSGGELITVAPLALSAAFLIIRFSPRRIELWPTELALSSPLRTRRIPYASIKSVHGDAGRLAWSTVLQMDLQDGKRIRLPLVETPIVETYDLITRHAGMQGSSEIRRGEDDVDEERP